MVNALVASQRSLSPQPVKETDSANITSRERRTAETIHAVVTPTGTHQIAPKPEPQRERWYYATVGSVLLPPLAPADESAGNGSSADEEATYSAHHDAQNPTSNEVSASADTQTKTIGHVIESLDNPVRGFMMKTRYSSSSNWLHSVMLVPNVVSWYVGAAETNDESWQTIRICKSLIKRLKQKHMVPWVHDEYGKFLPPKETADALVDAYLRTFETIYRILHVPTFRRNYSAFWEDPAEAHIDFLIQVQLCLVLGASLFDEVFSFRLQTVQWIREATAWLELEEKQRLSISRIQNMCLLSLARKCTQETHGHPTWIRSGSLLRSAMSIALHRDPTKLPGISPAQVEIRRRLWATVLELSLDSSLDAGCPPLISLDDFDCTLPMNLDDEQLDFHANAEFTPHGLNRRTDSSLQIALASTFPVRLAIANFANGIRSEASYHEVLKLSTDHKDACSSLNTSLRQIQPEVTKFQRYYCEMIVCRNIFTLHIPYFAVASKNTAYHYSRNACVDAALKLSHSTLRYPGMQDPFLESNKIAQEARCDDFVRLVLCASGPFRSVQYQALMIIAAELATTAADWSNTSYLHAIQPLGTLRGLELLSIVKVGTDWTRKRLLSRQDNVKDHVFMVATRAAVNAVIEGRSIQRSIEVEGREACLEAKELLTQLVSGDEAASHEQLVFEEETWDPQDFWTANVYDLDESLMSLM
ncbi:hypothetical protein SUNI508_02011 [Seiridium unicorne]|uniref:Xylanolytic transcriptional activator regulatory domain-containing protein n=1 Tax=Seiridium unicorne TaxID=138068 RepID=A0ABR2UKM3_9PEZI